MPYLASLPMYDLPEVHLATDRWWQSIAKRAGALCGHNEFPNRLDREGIREDHWRSAKLGMSQTCGYPLMQEFHTHLTVLGAPCYDVEDCSGHDYRSAFLVRTEDAQQQLSDMANRRLVVNGRDSQSGYNVIKARIGELQLQQAGDPPFFSDMIISGQHRKSLAAVKAGAADIAAVDVVTLGLLERHARDEIDGLAIIDYSAFGPSLPYVTSQSRSPEDVAALRQAISETIADANFADVRADLCLKGFDVLDAGEYQRINRITEQGAGIILAPNDP